MDNLITYPKFMALDANGDPLNGGLVYTYESGTSTPLTTYSDRALSVANANPVVLNSRGEAMIYCNQGMKIVLQDSAASTIWTEDDIMPIGGYLSDADDDTRVEVEKNPDEDKIRFTTGGLERGLLSGTFSETYMTFSKHQDLDGDTIINVEESNDEDKIRFDTGGTEAMIIDDSQNVGIGISTPDGRLHVHTATAGSISAAAAADDLIIENSGIVGMTFLTANDQSARIHFGDADDADVGQIIYNHSGDSMRFYTSAAATPRLSIDGAMVNVSETANAQMTTGITINQSASDDEILALKSSDVAHDMTTITETDTYCSIKKSVAADGGFMLTGLSDATEAVTLRGFGATADSTDPPTTSSGASIIAYGAKKSGTSVQALAATENLFQVENSNTNAFVVKGDGELYSNQSATVGTFDDLDDTQMLMDIRESLTGIKEGFITNNKDWLVSNKFMSHDGMLSLTKMMWLKVGALIQQEARISALEQKLLEA